ncbi:MAG: hypothetical protein LBD23_13505, partial [Oscillospiraceae bacterium]|nr:hypothetical protein [Oscillospiraceae bacterium]
DEYDLGDEGDDDTDTSSDADVNVNNYSLVTSINHGNNNFLFAGDAKARRIREILETEEIAITEFNFLKVPHHGVYNRRSTEFIHAISPGHAVITDSPERPADERIIAALNDVGAKIYTTKNGNIYIISNGNRIKV